MTNYKKALFTFKEDVYTEFLRECGLLVYSVKITKKFKVEGAPVVRIEWKGENHFYIKHGNCGHSEETAHTHVAMFWLGGVVSCDQFGGTEVELCDEADGSTHRQRILWLKFLKRKIDFPLKESFPYGYYLQSWFLMNEQKRLKRIRKG